MNVLHGFTVEPTMYPAVYMYEMTVTGVPHSGDDKFPSSEGSWIRVQLTRDDIFRVLEEIVLAMKANRKVPGK